MYRDEIKIESFPTKRERYNLYLHELIELLFIKHLRWSGQIRMYLSTENFDYMAIYYSHCEKPEEISFDSYDSDAWNLD